MNTQQQPDDQPTTAELQRKPGCLGFLARLLGPDEKQRAGAAAGSKRADAQLPGAGADGPMPYVRKNYLLSKAERSFFGVLQQAVGTDDEDGGRYLIFAMVRLADLVYIRKGTEKWQSWQNKIDRKHIDFVLCDKDTVKPLLAIELDDRSHETQKRQDRDGFVDAALQAAALPLLRVKAKAGYSVREIAEAVSSRMR